MPTYVTIYTLTNVFRNLSESFDAMASCSVLNLRFGIF